MNNLILSLAPFGGLASALPAMATANLGAASGPNTGEHDPHPTLSSAESDAATMADRELDGGYLLL